jgi:hypothetical protein
MFSDGHLGCLTCPAAVDPRVWGCEMKPIGSQHWSIDPTKQDPRFFCITVKPGLHESLQMRSVAVVLAQ